MWQDKSKLFYILSLLVLASLLVMFAQGVFTGLVGNYGEPIVEITRIDLYDDHRGNYSIISLFLTNNDTISYDYVIDVFFGDELENSFNGTIDTGDAFSYRAYVDPKLIPISQNETINSTLRVAKFVVYMDEQPEPIEEASFVFNNH